MSLKTQLSKVYASSIHKKLEKVRKHSVDCQKRIFHSLIQKAQNTQFGIDHQFKEIKTHSNFIQKVPIRDYEGLSSYFNKIVEGESNVLWKGKPKYIAKTSGTTSGTKYIPLTKESIKEQIRAAKWMLLSYIHHSQKTDFVKGKMIFLQGSPKLNLKNGLKIGRLSGIVAHHIPSYLMKNRLPSFETNCIENWEDKLDAVIQETLAEDMTLISGIPPWVKMYFERILSQAQKNTIKEVFPRFSLMVHGGVNYIPYQTDFEKLIGDKIDILETYPASEGFIAFQDDYQDPTLLLNANAGMFFEFVPVSEIHSENPTRLTLEQVELNQQYALIISSNAGLWAYNIGDTIKFTSLFPHKIVVTGRIKHFISTFGEHVIIEEVESSLTQIAQKYNIQISEFTVAPYMCNKDSTKSCHEWFIESPDFDRIGKAFVQNLDEALQGKNIYYKDIRQGNIISCLKITEVRKNGFIEAMSQMGKLGGQNKIPHVQNDRNFVNRLI